MSPITLTEAEHRQFVELLDREAIRDLRAAYSEAVDTIDAEALVALFVDDARCDFGPYGLWQGVDEIRRNYQQVFDTTIKRPYGSLHVNANHRIRFTAPDRAQGQAALVDVLTSRGPEEQPILWFALYDDVYVKTDAGWRFESMRLEFLWPERHVSARLGG